MKMKKKHRVYISRVVGNQGALIPRKYGCCYSLLSLSRPGFFGERQCQLSCGFHNFRFIKVTEAASSCVIDVIFRSEFTGAGNEEHDGTLRRLEYHRYLMFAGASLDLKGASWECLIYSHLTDLSHSVRPKALSSVLPRPARAASGA
jgi:hypothetical protein